MRTVQALKQQAKRRKRNTNLASSGTSGPQRVSSASRKSTFDSNGDIEIHYKPSPSLSDRPMFTMKEVLSSISGFSMTKLKRKMPKKLSLASAVQMAKDGSVDIETPDSILTQVNIRHLLNKNSFLKLPPEYQYKLMGLLPEVDRVNGKLRHSSLNNEFYTKASQEWKERLGQGDFLQENLAKTKADIEKDKQKTDPWKIQHFEPVWGIKKDFSAVDSDDESLAKKMIKNKRRKTSELVTTVIDQDDLEDQPLLKKVKSKEEPTLVIPKKAEEVVKEEEEEKMKMKIDIDKALILEENPIDEVDSTDGKFNFVSQFLIIFFLIFFFYFFFCSSRRNCD